MDIEWKMIRSDCSAIELATANLFDRLSKSDDPAKARDMLNEMVEAILWEVSCIADHFGGDGDHITRDFCQDQINDAFHKAVENDEEGMANDRQYSTMDVKTQGMTSPVAFVGMVR